MALRTLTHNLVATARIGSEVPKISCEGYSTDDECRQQRDSCCDHGSIISLRAVVRNTALTLGRAYHFTNELLGVVRFSELSNFAQNASRLAVASGFSLGGAYDKTQLRDRPGLTRMVPVSSMQSCRHQNGQQSRGTPDVSRNGQQFCRKARSAFR